MELTRSTTMHLRLKFILENNIESLISKNWFFRAIFKLVFDYHGVIFNPFLSCRPIEFDVLVKFCSKYPVFLHHKAASL